MKVIDTNLKRVIVEYSKLNDKILTLLVEKFPHGYGDKDIIAFRNAKAEYIECVEVRTEDTIYLVKVSRRLTEAMEDFDEGEDLSNEQELGFY